MKPTAEEYPERIYATEKVGSNGISCLDYRNEDEDVEYIRIDKTAAVKSEPAEGAEEIIAKEQFEAIVKSTCEDVWYGRRSLDPIKEQTDLIVERLYPLFENTALLAQRLADKMVEKQNEYIQLLTDELDDVAGIAIAHGWESHRADEGQRLRDEIKGMKGESK